MRRGLLPADDALAIAQWDHGGGFSVDASVRIAAADRAGRERLLRYCARPPLALDRRREFDPERLLYASNKPGPGGNGPLLLTPLQLLDRLAVLVPPPRIHRHRSFGVRAPHSPLRSAVTALARAATTSPPAPKPQPTAEPLHDILVPLGEPRRHPGSRPPAARRDRTCPMPERVASTPCPAGTGVRVRSTHRVVTPSVDRRSRTTPDRRMPTAR